MIVGGGALGIQYATDIADLYNNPANAAHLGEKAASPPRKKRITLVHSRDRFMPLYKQEVHDEVMRRMKELGVDVVLGERPDLGDVKDDKPGEKRILRLSDGREVEYDLLVSLLRKRNARLMYAEGRLTMGAYVQMRCTGQKPNSQLMRDFLPGVLDKHGYINVRDTLQVDLSRVPDQDRYSERVRRNLFAIGDVANAGVIKAGHTGWNQVRRRPSQDARVLQC
ncbi:MAG: NAD(P)/FAD-dependent oxidoreductase [Microbacterium hominis]|nr:NAD(P)/FAD-dependent oxidoreductase [Microbacterium hominis]